MINIDFLNNQNEFSTLQFEDIVKTVVEEALSVHDIKKDVEISVVFTDDDEIKNINKEFRNIDNSTDVLSFPQYEFEKPGDVSHISEMNLVLGDIIISLQHAMNQSIEYNHSFNREVGYLTAHSMLHLLGYDHIDQEDKKLMREKEELIMKDINGCECQGETTKKIAKIDKKLKKNDTIKKAD